MSAVDPNQCRLYGILDLSYVAETDVASVAEQMIDGGIDVIQLRAKGRSIPEVATIAQALNQITRRRNIPLVINDHAEIARSIFASGVHVGQNDSPISSVREIVGAKSMVGKSTHSVDQAIRAVDEGADYIGFGPILATSTKPDYIPIGLDEIQKVHQAVRLPVFCIGGIKLDNLSDVIAAGAQRVVIVSALLQAKDIASYARSAKQLLAQAKI